jgi:hypothetical protein
MYTIRRHLGRGKNYMHYQIRGYITDSKQGEVIEYINPDTHSIIFSGCRLHNKVNQSQKILDGASKAPCAWLIAESYRVIDKKTIENSDIHLRFNPRISSNWEIEGIGNVDEKHFDEVTMKEAKLFIK